MATQAIGKLQKKLDKDPNPSVFLQLAEEYRKEGLYREGIRVCLDGLRRHPNYSSLRVTLGRIYHETGSKNEAREELEKVIKAVPDHLLANRLLGDIYLGVGRNEDALKRFKIVQMVTPSDQEVLANIEMIETRMTAQPSEEIPTVRPEAPTAVLIEPPIEFAAETTDESQEGLDSRDPLAAESESQQEETEAETEQPNLTLPPVSDMNFDELSRIEPQEQVLAEAAALFLDADNQFDSSEEMPQRPLLQPSSEPDDVVFMELNTIEPSTAELPKPSETSLDHTQPMQEKEERFDEGDELTTETLAELYVQQGSIDQAIRVYQKLLLNDPNNVQIIQRLKELNPFDILVSSAIGPDVSRVENEPAQLNADNPEWAELPLARASENLRDLSDERKRKITTLENWLASIRRERS